MNLLEPAIILCTAAIITFASIISYYNGSFFFLGTTLAALTIGFVVVYYTICHMEKKQRLKEARRQAIRLAPIYDLDPDWKPKLDILETRLHKACYKWQLCEFGAATKSFEVNLTTQNGKVIIDPILPGNDYSIYDEIIVGKHKESAARAEEILNFWNPTSDAYQRLDAKLKQILSSSKLSPKTLDLLVQKGELTISTGWPFSDEHLKTGQKSADKALVE